MAKDEERCCCGWSLRTGTLIMLWLTLIGNGYYIRRLLFRIPYVDDVSKQFEEDEEKTFMKFYLYWSLVTYTLGFISSATGIIGVAQNVACCLTAYLYYMGYNVVLHFFSILTMVGWSKLHIIIYTLLNGSTESRKDFEIKFDSFLTSVIIFGLYLYFSLVVKDYQNSITKNADSTNEQTCNDSLKNFEEEQA